MSDVPSVVYRYQSQVRRSKAFRVTGPESLAINTQLSTIDGLTETIGRRRRN